MNKEWAEKNKQMQSLLKKNTFHEGIEELLNLRSMLMKEILSWRDYPTKYFYLMPYINADGYHSKSVAYSLWHIFRIEDIVVNSLIKRETEVLFAGLYVEKITSSIITTGNELVNRELEEFSKRLNIESLYDYITSVKTSTDDWIKTLKFDDIKTKYSNEDKEFLRGLQVVSSNESADWLIDYWCEKDIKGLIKMPLSRHWIMHIEASLRILQKIS
jgi:competence CoiA-like predicted nuclease